MKYWITWTSTPESLDMGGAPPHTDNRIRQAARGQGQVGLLKTTRQSQNALLNLLNLACNSSLLANAGRTARWNLALRPAETNNTRVNQRLCKRRNVAEPAA